MPSAPPASASAGSARYSAGSAAMTARVDVRRVAQDQVVAGRQRARARRTRCSVMRSVELVAVDVDARDVQRVGRDVGGVDRRRRGRPSPPAPPGCRCRCTGRARARCGRAQPGVERAVGQQLGDEASAARWRARRRRTARPAARLRRSGRRRACACRCAARPAPRRLACSAASSALLGHVVERVQRQAEAPQHQPGGFVEGVGRAVAERNARLLRGGRWRARSSSMQRHRRAAASSVRR